MSPGQKSKKAVSPKVTATNPAAKKTVNKKLVLRALTDPKFRKLLKDNPKEALDVEKLSVGQQREIQLILALIKGIDSQIASVADNLLCVNGDPCGIC